MLYQLEIVFPQERFAACTGPDRDRPLLLPTAEAGGGGRDTQLRNSGKKSLVIKSVVERLVRLPSSYD